LFALRRHLWARILLAISAAATAALSLLTVVAILPVVTLLPAVTVLVLLFTRASNAWYAGRAPTARAPRSQPW
jgi:hypothetical protein